MSSSVEEVVLNSTYMYISHKRANQTYLLNLAAMGNLEPTQQVKRRVLCCQPLQTLNYNKSSMGQLRSH